MKKIPDIPQCYQYMEAFSMLPNIRRHSIIVAGTALMLVEGFKESKRVQTHLPDKNLVVAGALLHDIAKTPCLKNGCDHARAGAEICESLGYHEIAVIVREHVVLKNHDSVRYSKGIFSATDIIYYADKRVRHEEIVSLGDRLEYILEQYGKGDPVLQKLIKENFQKCMQLEQYLFSFLPFQPDKLANRVMNSAKDIFAPFVSGLEKTGI